MIPGSTNMKELNVIIPPIAAGSYRITIGSGLVQNVLSEVQKLLPAHRPFIITPLSETDLGVQSDEEGSEDCWPGPPSIDSSFGGQKIRCRSE